MIQKNLNIDFSNPLISLIIFAGVILLICGIFAGITALLNLIFPLILVLSALAFLSYVLILMPMSASKRFRPYLKEAAQTLPDICHACVWIFSFLAAIKTIGWITVILVLSFRLIVPMALLILLVQGHWWESSALVAGVLITFCMRKFSQRYILSDSSLRESNTSKAQIIDIEAKAS